MIIEISNLKLNLGPHSILRDVNLTLHKGQIYGLLGPNGAGKSTTISVITGLRPPTAGSVQVLGIDPAVETLQLHRRIGVLAEQAGFYDWMSATDYLRWAASLYQIKLPQSQIETIIERVGLDENNPAEISTYSRGMRQRLGLARALINKPELLILDEPTNGLDPRGRREIHDVLLDLSLNHGIGILLCSHLLDDVDRLCTRIGIIAHGHTLLEGTISDLLSKQGKATRYRIRVKNIGTPKRLPDGITLVANAGGWWHVELGSHIEPAGAWHKLLNDGLHIDEIHREGGGLEELYLSVTETQEVAP